MSAAIAQSRGKNKVDDMADNEDATLALLQRIIESNGDTPKPEKDQALFIVLKEIYQTVKPLGKRVDALEGKSIIMWIEKHPKQAAFLFGVSVFLVNAWFVSDFRKPLLALLGLPGDLVP